MKAVVENKINVEQVRRDFPVLSQRIKGYPLIYLDNAASSQKPMQVIEAISDYYSKEHSNVHRGVHYLSSRATEKFEGVREKVRAFINARFAHEIIFTKGTTESINLAAFSFGQKFLNRDDEVIVSTMEHHSNIVPWQVICEQRQAKLRVIPVNNTGELIMPEFQKLINPKTRIIAVAHVSNSLGTINPIKAIIEKAHEAGVPVLVDGAQAVPHLGVDVQQLDADFYAFSSHKMYGPTGVGVLYGKEKFLNEMPPYQFGGEMIKSVSFEKTEFNNLPFKFEAGTPPIAGVIGLGAAIDFLNEIGLEHIAAREAELLNYATEKLLRLDRLRIVGTATQKAAVISFLVDKIHPYDVGVLLDQMGIAVRTGHHCTQPLMDRFGITGTIRASLSFYNTFEEIDELYRGVERAKKMLA